MYVCTGKEYTGMNDQINKRCLDFWLEEEIPENNTKVINIYQGPIE